MPDLSTEAVHQFWKQFQDPMIYKVVTFMEGVESWTKDGDEAVEAGLKTLSEALDGIGNYELGKQNYFIQLCIYLKAARSLRLMHWLDSNHPGAASKLLVHAEENTQSEDDPMGLFLRRNLVFERLRLLGRVFSEERFTLVTKALEGEYE